MMPTPRSGNNWLRHLLCSLYDMAGFAVHNPAELDWSALPADCLLAVHWHPSPSFLERLEAHRFRPLVLARHPLDVLVSILQFALHTSTERWLEGEGGNERGIVGAMPRSTAFLNYARGPRAAALLAVSHEWWQIPGCVRVRYENLKRDAPGELRRLADDFGVLPRRAIADVVAEKSLANLREATGATHHFWQGRTGLWKSLFPAEEAQAIARAHAPVFADLGYDCDPDPDLDAGQADANWLKLVWEDLSSSLYNLRTTQQDLRGAVKNVQSAREELEQARQEHQKTLAELGQARADLLRSAEEGRQLREALQQKCDELARAHVLMDRLRGQREQAAEELAWAHTELAHSQERRAAAAQELAAARAEVDWLRGLHEYAQAGLAQAHASLAPFEGLGPFALAVARRLKRYSCRYPRLAKVVRGVLRRAG
jgi:hypothetical protein